MSWNLDDVLSGGWLIVSMGDKTFYLRLSKISSYPSDVATAMINDAISRGDIWDASFPIQVLRLPGQMALMPYVDDVHDFTNTVFLSERVQWNMAKIDSWAFIDPRKDPDLSAFFHKYFEDIGGRVVTPGVADYAHQMFDAR
jgi:hypothetical protein